MYRYSVDNAITYSSEDLVLFKESPFASFMERLTLENPSHGIPPDIHSSQPVDSVLRQDDIADTLRLEGREVALIDWDSPEQQRRADTLAAMRRGVDFVVNGQLALGPLSGSTNLLMRTSGYSELGDFLFVPCSTQEKTTLQAAFRLCFLADLLHSLQGQLPPQMLIIRGGSKVIPLQTEDHIFHFRAVKQRFMAAQREFRKHRMPNPAESSHFGRWSDCANELLKQRALAGESAALPLALEPEELSQPVAQAAQQGAVHPGLINDELEAVIPAASTDVSGAPSALNSGGGRRFNKGIAASGTLADQAQNLSGAMPAPARAFIQPESAATTPAVSPVESTPQTTSRHSELLTDLQFIGKDRSFNGKAPGGVERRKATSRAAPESRLEVGEVMGREAITEPKGDDAILGYEGTRPSTAINTTITESLESARSEPLLGTPERASASFGKQYDASASPHSPVPSDGRGAESKKAAPHPLDSGEFNINHRSFVDRDDAPIPSKVRSAPPPTLGPQSAEPSTLHSGEFEDEMLLDNNQPGRQGGVREPREPRDKSEKSASKLHRQQLDAGVDYDPVSVRPFSNHLITNSDPQD